MEATTRLPAQVSGLPVQDVSSIRWGRISLASCESGAAILEFALVLPLLFALLAGCFEVGRGILVYQAMTEAVRGGARYLARVPDPVCRSSCSAGVTHAIEMTRTQIVTNTRLPSEAIRVSPSLAVPPGTVAMQAEVTLNAELLGALGLSPLLTLRTVHQEARVAE